MFQQMINGSIAVLTRPSVHTFEEHERDNLGWAAIYIVVGALISTVLAAIAFVIQRPYIERQLRELEQRLREVEAQGLDLGGFDQLMAAQLQNRSLLGDILSSIAWALIGYLVFLGIVFLLGKAFGGTGTFGQLAYDIALFWAPLEVLRALLNLIAIGPLAFLTALAGLAVFIYNIFLTYLGIQAGMNLPANKALYIILIIVGVVVALIGCVCIFLVLGIAALINRTG